jgi:hypothetical protein
MAWRGLMFSAQRRAVQISTLRAAMWIYWWNLRDHAAQLRQPSGL